MEPTHNHYTIIHTLVQKTQKQRKRGAITINWSPIQSFCHNVDTVGHKG